MTTVHVPSMEEMAQVAYLVCKGWIYQYGDKWSKPGQKREPTYEEAHNHYYKPDLEAFDLDDAVYRQQALDAEAETPCTSTSST